MPWNVRWNRRKPTRLQKFLRAISQKNKPLESRKILQIEKNSQIFSNSTPQKVVKSKFFWRITFLEWRKVKKIFYITNESRASVTASPFIESLIKKGYEALYLVDPIEEYMVKQIKDYEEKNSRVLLKKVSSLMRLRMKKETWWRKGQILAPLQFNEDIFGDKVEKDVIGSRIDESSCVLINLEGLIPRWSLENGRMAGWA